MTEQIVLFCASDLGCPLLFNETPSWLQNAIDEQKIKPFGAGEDYWYLLVQTAEGPVTAEPGDWIACSPSGDLTIRTSEDAK